jgi:glycosyltransferase involved in cell wall biosynthesis
MRLLQVNKAYFPHLGGVESIVGQVAEGLNGRNGMEVEVLACADGGRARTELINGVRVERAATVARMLSMPVSVDFFARFRRMAARADAVLLHHPFPLGFAAARLFARDRPCLVWYHSDIVRQRVSGALLAPLWTGMLSAARRIFVSSQRLLASSALLRRYRAKAVVTPFGVDLRRYAPSPERLAAAAEIRARYRPPLLLAVGRLIYYKGYEYLIAAMRRVSAVLLIVGAGPLERELLALAERIGVADRVRILPPAADLIPYYLACDVFVLPSIAASEAFGLVQMEAMACGKPVVNTALPTAVPEVSVDGETGLTVPARDSAALAAAIARLLGDDGLRQSFGANARARIRGHYGIERFLNDVEREIRAALAC